MGFEPITVSGVYTAEDLVGARLYMTRRNPLIRVLRFVPLAIPILAMAMIVFRRPQIQIKEMLIVSLMSLVVIAGAIVFSRFVSRPIQVFLTRRQLRSSPIMNEEKRFRVDLAGLSWDQDSSSGTLDWTGVLSVEENKDGFFFLTGRNFAHFVPKRFFSGPEDIVRAREVISAVLPGETRFLHE